MHSLHFVYRGFKCTHTSTNAYSLLRLQTNQCTDYQCSRDRYTAKGQLTEQLTQKQTCIYAHTHPKVIQYTDKSDRPACQSSSLLHDDGLVQRSGPHTISQREEKQPSSILIFFSPSSIFISSFIFISGYTEQIRELCVHFCGSLFEMTTRWRTVSWSRWHSHHFVCLQVASFTPWQETGRNFFWNPTGLCAQFTH